MFGRKRNKRKAVLIEYADRVYALTPGDTFSMSIDIDISGTMPGNVASLHGTQTVETTLRIVDVT